MHYIHDDKLYKLDFHLKFEMIYETYLLLVSIQNFTYNRWCILST